MLLVQEFDSKEFLTGLFNAMYDELPAPKEEKKVEKLSRNDDEVKYFLLC